MSEIREAIYKRAKLGGKVGFGNRPVIIVVDFQKGFTLPQSPSGRDMTDRIMNAVMITNAARHKNIKIIYTRLGFNKDGSDLTTFGKKAFILKEFVRDHWYYEWDDRLDIKEDDIQIEKHCPSVFFGTPIAQILVTLQIDTVVLCGCTVGGCVYASAVDSCSFGFKTIVVSDASADRSQEVYDLFLWNLGQKYADIMTTDEVICKIQSINSLSYA